MNTPFDRRAVRAHLGCLSAGPEDVSDGEWILVLEDADDRPIDIKAIGLVLDSKSAPVRDATEALLAAGFEHTRTALVARPWAASWDVSE